MKKFTFILAALFAVTFIDAQITLDHTFDEIIYAKTPYFGDVYNGIDAPYLYSFDENQLKMYDKETYELYKTYVYSIPTVAYPMINIVYLTHNIFTTDEKASFIFCFTEEDATSQNYFRIIDEDGKVVFDFNNPYLDENGFSLIKVGDEYKLLARESDYHNPNPVRTYIYSLPGNGETSTNIISPSSPKRSARKITRNGQILVETESNIYTLQGAEVR